jgi:sec-independent protein translocase protein TatA
VQGALAGGTMPPVQLPLSVAGGRCAKAEQRAPRGGDGAIGAIMRPGLMEILLILGIALLLFGAGRLADIGRGLGEGIRNFKKGIKEDDKDEGEKDKLPAKASKVESPKTKDEEQPEET